jgi:ribosomal protein S18 acetylase RimI-like enzyme
MINSLLDTIAWNTLRGHHVRYTAGSADARRYARGFSPIIGFPDAQRPNFAALSSFCEPDEHFYFEGWTGNPPKGWSVDAESTMIQMVWAGDIPMADEAQDATPLRLEHVAQALELTALTRPGPFGPRTFELGAYFGCFDGDRLVAMAGERMFAGSLREVSGVCTHPDFQGQGLAGKLMKKLIGQQLRRGETPFLHVARENKGARSLYERMGFRKYRETIVRVVSPKQA